MNNLQDKVDFIHQHSKDIEAILKDSPLIAFGITSDKDYIGIRNHDPYDFKTRSSRHYGKNVEVTIIFIGGGIWQYRYCNTNPSDKKYVSCEDFVDVIVSVIKSYEPVNQS